MAEKKRGAKTTRAQFMLYLDELENNSAFRTNKYNPSEPHVLDNSWATLTNKLNSVGGPCKSTKDWKKSFSDWKCTVRKKARILKEKPTGGGPPPEKPLNDLENKLLDLTGRIVVEGIPFVPELGLPNEEPEGTEADQAEQHVSANENQENVNNEVVVETHNAEMPLKQTRETPKCRITPRATLSDTVRRLNSQDEEHGHANLILREIRDNLKQLVQLETEKLEVEKLKLQLKYPDVTFDFSQ